MKDHPMQASELRRHIVLAGFMGSGKSTLARMLAGRLGTAYNDLDDVIEQRKGMPVRTIFETLGETQFRRLECEELAGLLAQPPHVLALGGGALAHSENRRRIGRSGLLIYIRVPPAILAKRLGGSVDRPLLLDQSGQVLPHNKLVKRIEALLEEREPLYMQADMVFEVASAWDPDQTLDHLQQYLHANLEPPSRTKSGRDS